MIRKKLIDWSFNHNLSADSKFLVRRPYRCDIVVIWMLCSLPREKSVRTLKNFLMTTGCDFFTDVFFCSSRNVKLKYTWCQENDGFYKWLFGTRPELTKTKPMSDDDKCRMSTHMSPNKVKQSQGGMITRFFSKQWIKPDFTRKDTSTDDWNHLRRY